MGFGDTMKKLIGIEEDDNFDYDISQEEIERERKRIAAETPAPAPASTARPARGIDEPLSAGVSSPRAESPYSIAEPMTAAPRAAEKRASMNASSPFKMVVIEPKHFDECRKLVDNLRNRKPVIINLEKVETDLARKMFDFMNGAMYALGGNVQRVTANIFIFAPHNVDINASLNRDNTEAGYTNNNNNNPSR